MVSSGRRSSSGRQVLVIDGAVPDPLFGFGFPRMFEIVQSLVRGGHAVSVYAMASTSQERRRMDRLCAGRVRFHRSAGAAGLRALLDGSDFDLVIVSRPEPMRAFAGATWTPAGAPPLVAYDLEAVTTPREARRRLLYGEDWSREDEAAALAAEIEVARGADAVVAVTTADEALVASLLPLPSFVLSHPVQVRPSAAPFAGRDGFLFVGRMTGSAVTFPNVDAVRWFVDQVVPQIDARMGVDYRIHLVGLHDEEAAQLASDRVILHGAVDDLDQFYERCRVFVAPTRYAAGVPIKVIEAIGKGVPCVTTPLLAQQVGAEGHGFTSTFSAEAFAEACVRLYTDPVAWESARDYGLLYAQQCFSQDTFDATVERLVECAVLHRTGAGRDR